MSVTFERYFLSRLYSNEKLVAYIRVQKDDSNNKYESCIFYRGASSNANDMDYEGSYYTVGRFKDFDEALARGEAEAQRLLGLGWPHPWEEPCPVCGKLIETARWDDKRRHSKARPCKE